MAKLSRQKARPQRDSYKFMQVIDRSQREQLKTRARKQGNITMQELIRGIVIPFYFKWEPYLEPEIVRPGIKKRIRIEEIRSFRVRTK